MTKCSEQTLLKRGDLSSQHSWKITTFYVLQIVLDRVSIGMKSHLDPSNSYKEKHLTGTGL